MRDRNFFTATAECNEKNSTLAAECGEKVFTAEIGNLTANFNAYLKFTGDITELSDR